MNAPDSSWRLALRRLSPQSALSRMHRLSRRVGFTLIEMLVVITIIAALLAMAVPTMSSVIQANRLTASGDHLLSLLTLANQIATVEGRPVEVRFVKYIAEGASAPQFQAALLLRFYATNEIGPDNRIVTTTPGISVLAADPVILPQGIIISSSIGLNISSIMTSQSLTAPVGANSSLGTLKTLVAGSLSTYNMPVNSVSAYCSVIIRSNGTSLPDPTANWYFTVIDENSETVCDFSKVHNFYMIQIDALNGHPTAFRP